MTNSKPLSAIRKLYFTDVFICIGKKQTRKVYKSFGFEDKVDFSKGVAATTFLIEGDRIIIYLSNKIYNYKDYQIAGLVAHEAYHAVHYIKSSIGEQDIGDDHTSAYLIQHITKKALKQVYKNKTTE